MNFHTIIKRVISYFILAVLLKIGLSVIGLKINDPFWFGFVFPITVMLGYWALGYLVRRKWDTQLTKAKFADSVYYLGFLFTVTSIIICLVDIDRIGDDLNAMAIRFGAAMVSTAIGMLARVIHTGFQVDATDALQILEERIIASSEKLSISLDNSTHEFEHFREKIISASQEAVLGVQEKVSLLYTHSIERLDTYFLNATQSSNEAFTLIIEDTKSASVDLLTIIKSMSEKSSATIARMENDTLEFGEKVRSKLEQTVFPEDLFSKKLNPSIDNLSGTTDHVNQGILSLADDVKTASRQVGNAIKGLNTKALQLEDNLATVSDIVATQEKLTDVIQVQNKNMLERVENQQKDFFKTLDNHQAGYLEDLKVHYQIIEKFIDKLEVFNASLANTTNIEDVKSGFTNILLGVSESHADTARAQTEGLREILSPLAIAVSESNETHRELTSKLEQGNQKIVVISNKLIDILGKIERVNSGLENISPTARSVSLQHNIDARTA